MPPSPAATELAATPPPPQAKPRLLMQPPLPMQICRLPNRPVTQLPLVSQRAPRVKIDPTVKTAVNGPKRKRMRLTTRPQPLWIQPCRMQVQVQRPPQK
jgi:hypothetical protein